MNDPKLTLTTDAIADYVTRFRRPEFPAFEISGLYDLSPDRPHSFATPPPHSWPAAYPFGWRAGVYLIFSESLDLLYVGKASMSSNIGSRLATYFHYGEAREMVLQHSGWSQPPRFFYAVAVPEQMPFEAPALEEFLIGRLQPPDNSVGR